MAGTALYAAQSAGPDALLAWVMAYLMAPLVASALGSFDGSGTIDDPWGTALVALLAVGYLRQCGCARVVATWPRHH